jgi:hypothetical protein
MLIHLLLTILSFDCTPNYPAFCSSGIPAPNSPSCTEMNGPPPVNYTWAMDDTCADICEDAYETELTADRTALCAEAMERYGEYLEELEDATETYNLCVFNCGLNQTCIAQCYDVLELERRLACEDFNEDMAIIQAAWEEEVSQAQDDFEACLAECCYLVAI